MMFDSLGPDSLDSHFFRFDSNDVPSLLGLCAAEDDALLIAGIIEAMEAHNKAGSRSGGGCCDCTRGTCHIEGKEMWS